MNDASTYNSTTAMLNVEKGQVRAQRYADTSTPHSIHGAYESHKNRKARRAEEARQRKQG